MIYLFLFLFWALTLQFSSDLLQYIVLDFYLQIAYKKHFPMSGQEYKSHFTAQWFKYQSPGFKFGAVMAFWGFSWLVQYVIQDTLAASLVSRLLERTAGFKKE